MSLGEAIQHLNLIAADNGFIICFPLLLIVPVFFWVYHYKMYKNNKDKKGCTKLILWIIIFGIALFAVWLVLIRFMGTNI